MAHTYIVRCSDGSYYVGSTIDLERRIWEHNDEHLGAAYTRHRRPVVLVWAAPFDSIKEAFAFEKQVQGWSRAKREALIRGDFDHLPQLAARRTSSTDQTSLADLADSSVVDSSVVDSSVVDSSVVDSSVVDSSVVSRRLLAQPPQPPVAQPPRPPAHDDPWQPSDGSP